MTTPAQQPEHCEHECVCIIYIGMAAWIDNLSPCNYKCDPSHDTRSRPHPPAPEQCPHWICVGHSDGDEWCCSRPVPGQKTVENCKGKFNPKIDPCYHCPAVEVCPIEQDEIDREQAARAATLAAYDKFMEAVEFRFDDTNNGRGVVGVIRGIKEKLRQQAGEQE